MRTPSIGWRFVAAGVGVVAVLVFALDLLLFLRLRAADPQLLTRLLVLEAVVTPLVLALAALLLRWITEIATKPLDEIAARARLTTLGLSGERLQPDRPASRLGQMATAYDEMLDSLEGAVAQARAARTESDRLERRTRKILDTARDAFLVFDQAGAIIDWNLAAERTFGWSRPDILGRSWEEALIAPGAGRQLEADRLDQGDNLWPYGAATVEMNARRRDGSTFPAGITVWTTTHDGVCTFNAFVRDLTERHRADEATAHLAAIVESSDQAILSTDADGRVLTWNPAAERMYGYSTAEAVGRPLPGLIIPEEGVARFDEALVAVTRGEPVKREDEAHRRQDGSLLHVSIAIAPLLDSTGAIYGACSVAQDMTERHRLAAQLDASLAALEAAAASPRRAPGASSTMPLTSSARPSPASGPAPRRCRARSPPNSGLGCSPPSAGRASGPAGSWPGCCASPASATKGPLS
ncbi:MAG: PAS domain S-box protein [Acidimicrobiales bacterium]